MTIERAIPTGLLAGCSPLASAMVASMVMYAARSQNVIAMSCCARRSAVSESARVEAKRQSTMIPASASMSESAPNAISAIDPATAPAAIATAASIAVPDEAGAGEQASPCDEPSRSGSFSGARRGAGAEWMTGSSIAIRVSMSPRRLGSWSAGRRLPRVRWGLAGWRCSPILAGRRGRSTRIAVAGRLLGFCGRHDVDAVSAGRAEIARYVRDLRERPGRHGANVVALDSGAGLAIATLQLRLTVVRLFLDFLVEEGVRDRNPVGRGYRAADGSGGRRGLIAQVRVAAVDPDRCAVAGGARGRRRRAGAEPVDARAGL